MARLRRARAKHVRAVHTAAGAVRWRPMVFLDAIFEALDFLKASWIGARPPSSSVHQPTSFREPMDGRGAHREKPMLVTFPEIVTGGGSPWGATRRERLWGENSRPAVLRLPDQGW